MHSQKRNSEVQGLQHRHQCVKIGGLDDQTCLTEEVNDAIVLQLNPDNEDTKISSMATMTTVPTD